MKFSKRAFYHVRPISTYHDQCWWYDFISTSRDILDQLSVIKDKDICLVFLAATLVSVFVDLTTFWLFQSYRQIKKTLNNGFLLVPVLYLALLSGLAEILF
jgi:hypothetical protein